MYTAKTIERASGGYCNSGIVRSWVGQGFLQPGPRAKAHGGPRTFAWEQIVKAVLMAELRQSGIYLGVAAAWAETFNELLDEFGKGYSQIESGPARYFVIDSGLITFFTVDEAEKSFRDTMQQFGSRVVFIDTLKLIQRISEVLHD